jgi:hypothetical protein
VESFFSQEGFIKVIRFELFISPQALESGAVGFGENAFAMTLVFPVFAKVARLVWIGLFPNPMPITNLEQALILDIMHVMGI